MSTAIPILRPLACWKYPLRIQRRQNAISRCLATISHSSPISTPSPHLIPAATKTIKTYPPPPSTLKRCKDPIADLNAMQIAILDPTGARTHFFSRDNPECAKVGDILLVRQKEGDPFAGVCMNIRRRGVDTGILLRNQLTGVGVEMWYKIYSPNVQGIEVVKRKEGRRARRARLTYMRKPEHDMGSVQNFVLAYQKTRSSLRSDGSAGHEKKFFQKKKVKKGKKKD